MAQYAFYRFITVNILQIHGNKEAKKNYFFYEGNILVKKRDGGMRPCKDRASAPSKGVRPYPPGQSPFYEEGSLIIFAQITLSNAVKSGLKGTINKTPK